MTTGPAAASSPAAQPEEAPSAPAARRWTDRDGTLLRVRLARPPGNVLDAELVAALTSSLTAVAGEDEPARRIRAVLLDAEGRNFSFGASVEEHLPESVADMLAGFHALVTALVALPVPVLVALRGHCLGGGLEVAVAGTRLFATPEVRLGQPEIALGVFAPAASCLLPERIGRGAAEDLLLSGRIIDGAEAHRIGLVDELAADPEQAALDYFDAHLAGRSASSLRHATSAARIDYVERVRDRLARLERRYLDDLMQTHDATEGLVAFLDKRPPAWEDR